MSVNDIIGRDCERMLKQIVEMQKWFGDLPLVLQKDVGVEHALNKLSQARGALEALTIKRERTK